MPRITRRPSENPGKACVSSLLIKKQGEKKLRFTPKNPGSRYKVTLVRKKMNLSPKMIDCIQELIAKLLAEFENAYMRTICKM